MGAFNNQQRVLWATALALIGAPAHAAPCSNATLNGAYGFQEEGQFVGGGFSEFRSIGVFNFNGQGTGSRTTRIWYSNFSVSFEPTFPLTYTVNPDCTLNFTYTDSGETFTGVIVQSGQKLLYIETTGDPSRSGQAEKVGGSTKSR